MAWNGVSVDWKIAQSTMLMMLMMTGAAESSREYAMTAPRFTPSRIMITSNPHHTSVT